MPSPVVRGRYRNYRRAMAGALAAGLAVQLPGCASTVSEKFLRKDYGEAVAVREELAKRDTTEITARCANGRLEVTAKNHMPCQLNWHRPFDEYEVVRTSRQDGSDKNEVSWIYVVAGIGLIGLGSYYLATASERPEVAPPLPSDCPTGQTDNTEARCKPATTRGQQEGIGLLSIGLGALFTPFGFTNYATGLGDKEKKVRSGKEPYRKELARCKPHDSTPLLVKVHWPDGSEAIVDMKDGRGSAPLPAADMTERWASGGRIELSADDDTAELAVVDCEDAVRTIEAKKARDEAARARQVADNEQRARDEAAKKEAEERAAAQAAAAAADLRSASERAELLDVWDTSRGDIVSITPLPDEGYQVVTTKGEVWVTQDGGMTWIKRAGAAPAFEKAIATAGAELRLTVTQAGVVVERGSTELFRAGPPSGAPSGAIVDADALPGGRGNMVALLYANSVLLGQADGTWRSRALPGGSQGSSVFLRGSGGKTVFVLDTAGRVWRSDDGDFTGVEALAEAGPIAAVTGAWGRAPDLYALARNGSWWTSSDGGSNWSRFGVPLDSAQLGEPVALAVHPRYAVVIGAVYRRGVVWSFDGGRRWRTAVGVREGALADAHGIRWVGHTAVVWGGRRTGIVRLVDVQERATFAEKESGESGQVLFASGKAQLQPEATVQLRPIAQKLLSHTAVIARVEGHTDAQGDADKNLQLSRERAESVRQALIGLGVPGDRITTAGFGSSRPIATADAQGRSARNRRVEVILVLP